MKEVNIKDVKFNPFDMVGEEWLALMAGNEDDGYNAMTIAWGHFGALWEKKIGTKKVRTPTCIVYVRPQRYTRKFMDHEDYYTINYLGNNKRALAYLGSRSGRDEDKLAKIGLTPEFGYGTTYIKEAKMVFVCKKIYQDTLKEENFIDQDILDFCYPNRDFHDMYVGEVVQILGED